MTVGARRRLLSIDLLDGGEHDRLDEWGNRAVLKVNVSRSARISCPISPRRAAPPW
jgi:glycopeptidolipid biosynthesis protein